MRKKLIVSMIFAGLVFILAGFCMAVEIAKEAELATVIQEPVVVAVKADPERGAV